MSFINFALGNQVINHFMRIICVLARGATLENVSVYSYYSVKYWCGGAALPAKLGILRGWVCGFAGCAAWAGYTLGLHLSHITSFSGYTVSFVSHIGSFVNYIANFVSHIRSFVNYIARFGNHIVSFVSYVVNFVGNVGSFVRRGAYFSSYTALF